MSKRPSLARLDLSAGLVGAAMLLLANAASADGAHVSAAKTAGMSQAPKGPLARRCEPPPCPARVLRGSAKRQGPTP